MTKERRYPVFKEPGLLTDDTVEQAKLRAAFAASNAICDLSGCPYTDDMRRMEERIIIGEITFDEAIQEIISKKDKAKMTKERRYPVFKEPGLLTDDTVLTGLGAGLTAQKFDEMLLNGWLEKLEGGNQILQRLETRFPGFDV